MALISDFLTWEIIGWVSTLLVLAGYIANSSGYRITAMTTWIAGDIGWILYDLYIDNYSHMVLSLIIISINIFGIIRLWKRSLRKKRFNKESNN